MAHKKIIISILSSIVFLVVVAWLICFTVDENQTVVITQFGKDVKTINEPGLHFKLPAPIQNIMRFSRKLNVFETIPTEILTQDKKNLLINNYVLWKIENPLQFFKTVKNLKGALIRLEDIVYSQMRNEVGLYSFSEIITSKRDEISENITQKVKKECEILGINIAEIRLKKISFPSQNLPAIYRRMIAERNKMATKYRSEGKEEATKIRSETDREKTVILAKSYKEAETIKGEGESTAMKNYAKVIKRDNDFYSFVRSMEIYSKIINQNSTLILSTKSDLLKYLKPPKRERQANE